MYESLRTARAVERAFQAGRHVYFRATIPWEGRWIRMKNRGRAHFAHLLKFGEFRTRVHE